MNSKKDVRLGNKDRLEKLTELSFNAHIFYFYFLQKKSDFYLRILTFTQNFRAFLFAKIQT